MNLSTKIEKAFCVYRAISKAATAMRKIHESERTPEIYGLLLQLESLEEKFKDMLFCYLITFYNCAMGVRVLSENEQQNER